MAWLLTHAEERMMEDCLLNLRALPGCEVDPGFRQALQTQEGSLRLKGVWGQVEYRVLPRRRLSPLTIAVLLNQVHFQQPEVPRLLFTDYLPETLARELRQHGIEYVDAAGNMYLCQPPLLMEIGGRRRAAGKKSGSRAFQTAGLKLISILLMDPASLRLSYRDMAQRANVALGTIGQTLEQLESLGYLSRDANGSRMLLRGEDLLQRWEFGYSEKLRPRLLLRRCRLQAGVAVEDLPDLLRQHGLQEQVLIGGELGAALLLGGYRPQRAALHLSGDALRLLMQLRLIPDPDGPVDLLQLYGNHLAWQEWQPEGVSLIDPLLIHAELTAVATDGVSLAERVWQVFLQERLVGREAFGDSQ
ncbi:type IV toxin-antitoxin system AbiEi family antitoxin [Desulfuromonas sp. AOP6]|uniref:type IV toxin-antitoxin system AbiEi family antitoxin n=1 Tax=Desulfuromonas sp. AOP6 TaxID=1566351 RepID=UPI001289353C|nr:type IV toxin-antitoxin system AbiEi family antitoxin [Desulfuromonas sp. AOP6]BCA80576.1 hypothetical protein AOP6_2363 [Desulfuromonas sp. AOP6]